MTQTFMSKSRFCLYTVLALVTNAFLLTDSFLHTDNVPKPH